MKQSLSKRRMIQNEVVFRRHNENIQKGLQELRQLAVEDNQQDFLDENDMPLHFYCECSDENCTKRIIMKPSRYAEIHKHRNQFVVLSGHETNSIEKVIKEEDDYSIVEKYLDPPKTATNLQPTPVNNV